ncbi:hypothetical protein KM043_010933 [Ampulex compressa]|nr:hypothetical protein KM043_010933 [Ampulex compressa]
MLNYVSQREVYKAPSGSGQRRGSEELERPGVREGELIRLYINTTLFWNIPRDELATALLYLTSSYRAKKRTWLYLEGTVSLVEITWIIGVSINLFFSQVPSSFELTFAALTMDLPFRGVGADGADVVSLTLRKLRKLIRLSRCAEPRWECS